MADPTGRSSFEEFKQEFSLFVEREKELAKAELVPAAKSAGIGAGMYTGAGLFALHALWMILLCIALGVGWLLTSFTELSPWGAFTVGFLLTALFSLLVAFVLFKVGQANIKKVKAPSATISEAKTTLSALADSAAGKGRQLRIVEDPEHPESIA